MKTFTALIIADALIAPHAASAQRVTTPNTAERHKAAQAEAARDELAKRASDQLAGNEDETGKARVPAAKAGKVNTAKPTVSTI